MAKTAIFIDTGNLYFCMSKRFPNRRLDYSKVREIEVGDDSTIITAYGINDKNRLDSFITMLSHLSFATKFKAPDRTGCAAEMALDMMKMLSNVDNMVVYSTDPSLAPAIAHAVSSGCPVKVVGCGIPHELRKVASSCMEIDEVHMAPETQNENAA